MMMEAKWLKRIFYVLAVGLLILILYLAHLLAAILIPLVLAVFTLLLLHPFIRQLQKAGFPRSLASILVMSLFFLVLGVLFVIFYFSFHQFLGDVPKLLGDLNKTLIAGLRNIAGQKWMQKITDEEKLVEAFSLGWKSVGSGQTLIYTLLGTLNMAKGLGLYLIYLIFMLMWMESFGPRIDRAFTDNSFRIKRVIAKVTGQVQNYILIKTFVSFLTGVVSLIVCLFFGVNYAFLWGFVFFTLNFIPYIGSTIAVSLPVLISIIQFQSLPITFGLLFILFLIQQLIGSILEPILQSDGANLSPFVIILGLLFFGYIWGIAGVILTIPIMSALNLIFGSIDSLRPVSILISVQRKKR